MKMVGWQTSKGGQATNQQRRLGDGLVAWPSSSLVMTVGRWTSDNG